MSSKTSLYVGLGVAAAVAAVLLMKSKAKASDGSVSATRDGVTLSGWFVPRSDHRMTFQGTVTNRRTRPLNARIGLQAWGWDTTVGKYIGPVVIDFSPNFVLAPGESSSSLYLLTPQYNFIQSAPLVALAAVTDLDESEYVKAHPVVISSLTLKLDLGSYIKP